MRPDFPDNTDPLNLFRYQIDSVGMIQVGDGKGLPPNTKTILWLNSWLVFIFFPFPILSGGSNQLFIDFISWFRITIVFRRSSPREQRNLYSPRDKERWHGINTVVSFRNTIYAFLTTFK